MMLDSGSSISLVQECVIPDLSGVKQFGPKEPRIVSAAGETIPVMGHIHLPVKIGQLYVDHSFVVVHSLITPVILGIDFLRKHHLVLDFTSIPIGVKSRLTQEVCQSPELELIWKTSEKVRAKTCAVVSTRELTEESLDDCTVPLYYKSHTPTHELPLCPLPLLSSLLEEHKDLFRTVPGHTDIAEHFIPTSSSPVKIPPRRIPANYRTEVQNQLQAMLEEGIIEESSSPWMAPAVYTRKKNGDIQLCVDYRELNKRTVKDAYPLPRPDEVQDQLAGSTIFSTLDLQSGYWQLPVHPEDQTKTAFSPGPGMGLFQFRRMPFWLSGAPASFQRLMDKVCRGLPFTTTYLDDVLVHSATVEDHKEHLRVLFQRMSSAGLTLRGKKCHIGMDKVTYLGHEFSAAGMEPDKQKVTVVQEWETPKDVTDLRSFLGLASYYRRYISNFADIAAPLHRLTDKGVPFSWDADCQSDTLKARLTQAPVLRYPEFFPSAAPFQLQTDASAVGLGVVLEQNGHVIAYASRILTPSERNYSVIQKECLALVYGMKQFRHYLLGRHFAVLTDHAPLQWLSGQKMEGLLARWALALQEFDFSIVYRKGCLNSNADALSRRVSITGNHSAATSCSLPNDNLLKEQQADPVLGQLRDALSHSPSAPIGPTWKPPLNRYRQLWSQLTLKEGLVCRQYVPGPTMEPVTVPLIPRTLQLDLIHQYHDTPGAAHLGPEKTAAKVRHVGYWVGMLHDINNIVMNALCARHPRLPLQ